MSKTIVFYADGTCNGLKQLTGKSIIEDEDRAGESRRKIKKVLGEGLELGVVSLIIPMRCSLKMSSSRLG
ncbi:MAG: hypothetical protein AB7F79_00700 [Steroidobacteraceae bacterium]